MTWRISLVAVFCSLASVSLCRSPWISSFSSAYDRGAASLTGAPHSRQDLACAGLSCWHRGHFIPGLPAAGSAEGRNRGPRLTARDSLGQEHGHTERGHTGSRPGDGAPPRTLAGRAICHVVKRDRYVVGLRRGRCLTLADYVTAMKLTNGTIVAGRVRELATLSGRIR